MRMGAGLRVEGLESRVKRSPIPGALDSQPSTLNPNAALCRKSGCDRQIRRQQLSDQHEDQRHVEKPRRRLVRLHVRGLPDEIGKSERAQNSPGHAEEKEEGVPLQRQKRREPVAARIGHDRGGEKKSAQEGQEREQNRASREQSEWKRPRDEVPVSQVHRQENGAEEEATQKRPGYGPRISGAARSDQGHPGEAPAGRGGAGREQDARGAGAVRVSR